MKTSREPGKNPLLSAHPASLGIVVSQLKIVLTTCPQEQAQSLATSLIERRLAACVNLLPGVSSVYRWQGKVVRDEEALLIIKTPPHREAELFACLEAEHPNDVPEIISLPTDNVLESYLNWAHHETQHA